MKIINPNWIWLPQDKIISNQYVQFRKQFELKHSVENAIIEIAAESDFVLYVNGVQIAAGQSCDYFDEKNYTSLNIGQYLLPGFNSIAVLGYYSGGTCSKCSWEQPGIWVRLYYEDNLISSDSSWKCRLSPEYYSGNIELFSEQIGYVFAYDARNEDAWIQIGFDDSDWEYVAVRLGDPEKLIPRPLPLLERRDCVPTKVLTQGFLYRIKSAVSFAGSFQNDYLCPQYQNVVFKDFIEPYSIQKSILKPNSENNHNNYIEVVTDLEATANGFFVIIDLGKQTAGLINIELDTSAGIVCDITVGEHINDGRVRSKYGEKKNFTDRYICHEGLNRFEYQFRRVSGRYIEVHFTNVGSILKIIYIGIRPLEVNIPLEGFFRSNDIHINKLYNISVNTLKLCMHDHYEDCPWREQSLYAYDSRNQALFGYYPFGNYDFAATSLSIIGKSIRPDGLLDVRPPKRLDRTIPVFSFVWISSLFEYYIHSGSVEILDKFKAQIEFMIESILENYDRQTGLFNIDNNVALWNFYEWTDGLKGDAKGDLQAPYNLFLLEMFNSCSKIFYITKDNTNGQKMELISIELAAAINNNLWDEKKNAYCSTIDQGKKSGYHELVQILALYNNIVPGNKLEEFLENIYVEMFPLSNLSSLPYMVTAMMRINPSTRKFLLGRLMRYFDPMVDLGSSTVWETEKGCDDFGGIGSLCHGWSAVCVYFFHAYILGVRPLQPGFKTIALSPYTANLYSATGTVVTPYGNISVSWKKNDDGLNIIVNGPESIECILLPFVECPVHKAVYNNHRLSSSYKFETISCLYPPMNYIANQSEASLIGY